jgi:8-oxo-dGTP pyrophosphatase MutT (NUDIX family)
MKKYVVTFLFNPGLTRVVLIRKTHPKWMAGKLAGVGGLIEEGETPEAAASREFGEEAGLYIPPDAWKCYLRYRCSDPEEVIELNCFWAISDRMLYTLSLTDEQVTSFGIPALASQQYELLRNTPWFLAMALAAARQGTSDGAMHIVAIDEELGGVWSEP